MSLRQVNVAPIIDSQGEKTNPTTSTVMADTGAIVTPGNHELHVLFNASAAADFQIQRRNAANDANVDDVVGVYIPATGMAEIVWFMYLNKDERARVMMDDNLTGTAWVSINAKLVS